MAPTPLASSLQDDPGLGPGLARPAAPLPAELGPVPPSPPRPTGFVSVDPGAADANSALPSLVAAYVLMWLVLLGFVWLLGRRQARTEARLGVLERAVLKPPSSP